MYKNGKYKLQRYWYYGYHNSDKSNICLHYVQCTHTNASPSDVIQGDSIPGARVGVYRAFVDKCDWLWTSIYVVSDDRTIND
jgi:hypothetical protein